jgi:3-phytase
MGIGLYRRSRDGAIFAIVAPKAGPKSGYLWQYRLGDDGTGRVGAMLVRRFGSFSGVGEIEAIVVDDELGYVYYADEASGIHKWHADPDAKGADQELALFGQTGYEQDREGLGIYDLGDGTGYIVSVDQLPGESVFHVYHREGTAQHPHDHGRELLAFKIGADGTDGLEVSSASLAPDFPDGLLAAMNARAGRSCWSGGATLPRPQIRRFASAGDNRHSPSDVTRPQPADARPAMNLHIGSFTPLFRLLGVLRSLTAYRDSRVRRS